ncbi:hypothetical protein Tco_1347501, partial [Tanacetum coccineum]
MHFSYKDVRTCNCERKDNKKNDVRLEACYSWLFPMNINLLSRQYNDAKKMFAAIGKHELECQHSRRLKFKKFRSLPPEWNTHVVVWMNKADIETMSIDDLHNNFKIPLSVTNDVNTANPAYEVSTVSPNVNTDCPQVSTANFNDNTVYAFKVKNPNGSNLLQQDLKQIHEDDLEAMDLKWQLSLLSMRAKWECRVPRNKEGQFRYQDNTRKQGNNEDTSSKAMLAIDGVGFDWSDMATEQVQTNMAL